MFETTYEYDKNKILMFQLKIKNEIDLIEILHIQ
jgi:hypothetical protein